VMPLQAVCQLLLQRRQHWCRNWWWSKPALQQTAMPAACAHNVKSSSGSTTAQNSVHCNHPTTTVGTDISRDGGSDCLNCCFNRSPHSSRSSSIKHLVCHAAPHSTMMLRHGLMPLLTALFLSGNTPPGVAVAAAAAARAAQTVAAVFPWSATYQVASSNAAAGNRYAFQLVHCACCIRE